MGNVPSMFHTLIECYERKRHNSACVEPKLRPWLLMDTQGDGTRISAKGWEKIGSVARSSLLSSASRNTRGNQAQPKPIMWSLEVTSFSRSFHANTMQSFHSNASLVNILTTLSTFRYKTKKKKKINRVLSKENARSRLIKKNIWLARFLREKKRFTQFLSYEATKQ